MSTNNTDNVEDPNLGKETDVSFLFDSNISAYTGNNIKSMYETTWFYLILQGLRLSFNRIIQSSTAIGFTFTDRYKEMLLEQSKNSLKYPYAYIVANDLDLVKDQASTVALSKRGLNTGVLRGNAVGVSYVFPFKMNITLNVLDYDVNSLFALSQAIFLADVSRAFNYGVKAFGQYSIVKVVRTGNISFNDNTINTEQENDFGTGHITCSFEVNGKMGFTSLSTTVKTINVNVFTNESLNLSAEAIEDSVLDFSYTIDLSEAADGKITNTVSYSNGSTINTNKL